MNENKGNIIKNFPNIILFVFIGIFEFLTGLISYKVLLVFCSFSSMLIFYIYYSIPQNNRIIRDLGILLLSLIGSSMGSLLLWISCKMVNVYACKINIFRVEVFIIYVFTLIWLLSIWLFVRIPAIIRNFRMNKSLF
jgi:hypothetical protein